ncbi:MAG: ABC transporter ATP-binding protein [Actinomycetia bacterium]|nr:ABC transporter ATP-binding protein [Actinomycetes bacterium]
MPVLDLSDVTVVRGGTRILDQVTWRVEEGERWVILGPNGAGKTTLLQIASARMHPTSGSADVLGERLGAVDVFELRPRIGLTSAALAELIPAGERVLDVVMSAGYAVTGRWREEYLSVDSQRAADLLARLGAGPLAERSFRTLSEGERKRVQIARALMTDPELLILDEPAAGLDLGSRDDLLGRLSEIAATPDGPVMVLVTHHVEEIPQHTTHALLMRGGRVVAAGPLDQVVTTAWLTATFGLPLLLSEHSGRYFARALLPPTPHTSSPAPHGNDSTST